MSETIPQAEAAGHGDFEYREANIADAAAMANLTARAITANRGEFREDTVASARLVEWVEGKLAEPTTWSQLVIADGEPIACAYGYPSPDSQRPDVIKEHLDSLMVDPRHWNKGHGSRLLDWASDTLRARGVNVLDLWVDADNDGARRLYERKGFAATGKERIHETSQKSQFDYAKTL